MRLIKIEKVIPVMQIVIDEIEIKKAPEAVRAWITSVIGIPSTVTNVTVEAPDSTAVPKNVAKAKKDKAIEAPVKDAEAELDLFGEEPAKPVTLDDVRTAAMAVVKKSEDGNKKVLACLTKVGAKNFKECPTEKLAELLAMLSLL